MFYKTLICSDKESVIFLVLVTSILLTPTQPLKVIHHTNFAKVKDILGKIEGDLLVLTYVPLSMKLVLK